MAYTKSFLAKTVLIFLVLSILFFSGCAASEESKFMEETDNYLLQFDEAKGLIENLDNKKIDKANYAIEMGRIQGNMNNYYEKLEKSIDDIEDNDEKEKAEEILDGCLMVNEGLKTLVKGQIENDKKLIQQGSVDLNQGSEKINQSELLHEE